MVVDHALESWHETLELNLTSAFLGMKHMIPLMIGEGRGAIVNLSSISGVGAEPDAPAYQAAKNGIRSITRSAALAYAGYGIRVNAVTPSMINTPAVGARATIRSSGASVSTLSVSSATSPAGPVVPASARPARGRLANGPGRVDRVLLELLIRPACPWPWRRPPGDPRASS